MQYPTAKSWGVLKQRIGVSAPPHTSIGVGQPGWLEQKSPAPRNRTLVAEPESDADPTEPNRFGTAPALSKDNAIITWVD